jgi:hypothetical protein
VIGNDSVGVTILHGMLAIPAFFALVICSRNRLPLASLVLGFAVVSWSLRFYFHSISTEWVAFSVLVTITALLLVPRAAVTRWRSMTLLMACALMPLLRPALMGVAGRIPLRVQPPVKKRIRSTRDSGPHCS